MNEALVAATVLTAIGTLGLAIATVVLALKTRDMADATQETVAHSREMVEINRSTLEQIQAEREARERPRVRVDIDYDHPPWLYVVVRNLGGGPATSVRFDFTPELVTPESASPAGEGTILLSQRLRMFTRGLPFLAAGAEIPVWWGASELIVGYFYENDMHRYGIRVEIFYESADGQNRYEDRVFLNPVDMEEAMRFRPENLSRLVNPVVKAAEKLDKAIDYQGYVKIKTFTERSRESRARFEEMMRHSEEVAKEVEQRRNEHNEQIRKRLEEEEQSEE